MAIQSETYTPEHMRSEKDKWTAWLIMTIGVGVLSFALFFAVSPLIWWSSSQSFNAGSFVTLTTYLSSLGSPDFVLRAHTQVWQTSYMAGFTIFGVAGLAALFVASIVFALCPFKSFEATHGDVRWATDKDIRNMEARKQIGVRDGRLGVLGRVRKDEYVSLIETLSVLCLAPPGSGKTAGLVVPSLVNSNDCSFIVNDPKPELHEMTSGFRAEVGVCLMIDWSATDKPEQGLFYPRFNFLSRRLVPPVGTAERDTYLDAVAKVLVPEAKGDKYFTDKGRDCLVGFMHFLVSKVNDQNNYVGIPLRFQDKEASFPMLVDFLAEAQFQAAQETKRLKKEAQEKQQFLDQDAMSAFISKLAEEARANNYSPRAFTSLSPLIEMADKERSGVLGTMDQALLPFKNSAVMQRTEACDFIPSDLRGMKDPETGEWLPVTLYICVNQAEAQAFSNITALLYEVLSRDFLSYGPGETDKRGVVQGPFPICFMMDEFAKLPKIDAVMTGPDLGRSKKTSYFLIAQSKGQIEKIYSKEDFVVITSTTAVKHVLPQNDADTANDIIKAVGKTTIKKESHSRSAGLSKSANPFAKNVSIASEGVDFLRMEDVTSMKPGSHIVLAQNFMNRPIKCETPFFFEDEAMLSRVYNPRTHKGPPPAPPLPEFLRRSRAAEWATQAVLLQTAQLDEQAERLRGIAAAPEGEE